MGEVVGPWVSDVEAAVLSQQGVQAAKAVAAEMVVVRAARQHIPQERHSVRKISGKGEHFFHKTYRTAYDLVKVEQNYKDCLMQRSFFFLKVKTVGQPRCHTALSCELKTISPYVLSGVRDSGTSKMM
jgi:hypothetical protein